MTDAAAQTARTPAHSPQLPALNEWAQRLSDNVARVLVGKEEVTALALAGILAGGHLLFEDVPGTGKTMLARSLAVSLGLDFSRVQFTPDLLPSDITGVSVLRGGDFQFVPGPLFTNILLADEINRATPKTQSALLEAMAEAQVTENGVTHTLAQPFVVMATQNPVEQEGTYRLPEAQLDRFLLKLSVGYPGPAQEVQMLENLGGVHPIEGLMAVSNAEELSQARAAAARVHVSPELRGYIAALTHATRSHGDVALGAGPRASLALQSVSRSLAWMQGGEFVSPDHIKAAARYALPHRLVMRIEARMRGVENEHVVREVLGRVPVPVEAS